MRLAWLLSLASCATLNTSGMSDSCRTAYNICLNQCPSAQAGARRPLDNQNGPAARWDTTQPLMVDVASCTNKCNEGAKLCR